MANPWKGALVPNQADWATFRIEKQTLGLVTCSLKRDHFLWYPDFDVRSL